MAGLDSSYHISIPASPSQRPFSSSLNGGGGLGNTSSGSGSRWRRWLFPHMQNEKVLLTHAWVSLNYWICGGPCANLNYHFLGIIFLALLILLSSVSWVLSGSVDGVRQSIPSPISLPDLNLADGSPAGLPVASYNRSDPDQVVLNLGLSPVPYTPLDPSAATGGHAAAWDANRQYGIVIDAGSSGSRILLYSWKDGRLQDPASPLGGAKPVSIEWADKDGRHFQLKQEPGISSFANNPDGVASYLAPLLAFAAKTIPPHKHAETPIFLYATAGLRLVPEQARETILHNACSFVQSNYKFATPSGCDHHFRLISGELEGIFGWLAVNYLKGGLNGQPAKPSGGIDYAADSSSSSSSNGKSSTYGFLDMGGASAQIAFVPTDSMAQLHADDLVDVRLRLRDGSETTHHVFVSTFLGFGANQAWKRHTESLMLQHVQTAGVSVADHAPSPGELSEGIMPSPSAPAPVLGSAVTLPPAIVDPCLPTGLVYNATLSLPAPPSSSKAQTFASTTLQGSGSFDSCLAAITPLLNKHIPCHEKPCLFNGVHAPVADFRNHHFIGVSEFWYTAFDVYELGGSYDYQKLLDASRRYCATPWKQVVETHEKTPYPHVEDLDRLRMQCFKSAWVMSVLHDGLGIPKEQPSRSSPSVDPKPHFESVNEIDSFSVSWTLGAILMYASSTVPAAPKFVSGESRSLLASNSPADVLPSNTVLPAHTSYALISSYSGAVIGMVVVTGLVLVLGRSASRLRSGTNSNSRVFDMSVFHPRRSGEMEQVGISMPARLSDAQRFDNVAWGKSAL
ncbi:nucleoside phosphatase family-domain-containing protein [Entophlyctis helioformis]|nr:nucleoside phosphatase family-domain-containing protein [Entophlyctis helioformis]